MGTEIVPTARSLEFLDSAHRALTQAQTIDELKDLRDAAVTAQVYAKQILKSLEIQNDCAEIKLGAERKAGDLLSSTTRPGNPQLSHDGTIGRLPEGIDRKQSSRWQAVARVPKETFEAHVAEVKAAGDELTTAGVLRLEREIARQERTAEKRQRSADLAAVEVPTTLDAYPVLCADPPWRYDANATPDLRSIENHYPTLTLEEQKRLEVPAAEDAVMFMWATSPKLAEALDLLAAWGFDYRTCMVWVKDKIGMGYYARQQHELLLIGRRGNLAVPDPEDRPSSVIEAPRTEHSRKPQEAYDAIARMYPVLPRVELFARGARPGWSVWGNEAEAA